MTDLNSELFELSMSEKAKPLLERVIKHLEENVAPWRDEFEALNEEKEDRWKRPRPRPRKPACGTSSCRMPTRARACRTSTMPISPPSWASIPMAPRR